MTEQLAGLLGSASVLLAASRLYWAGLIGIAAFAGGLLADALR